jgi:hypothetical protein
VRGRQRPVHHPQFRLRGDKKPDEKKSEARKTDLVGTVKELSDDGKLARLVVGGSLQPPPNEKNKEPAVIDIQINKGTTITAGNEAGKLAVGQIMGVWLGKGGAKIAVTIQTGKPPEKPE